MSNITLGQLFLLRRDLKNELSEKEQNLRALALHREDQPAPEESYTKAYEELSNLRKTLFRYDSLIEQCNSLEGQVEFQEQKMSLHMARHLKVHLNGEAASIEQQIRWIEPFVVAFAIVSLSTVLSATMWRLFYLHEDELAKKDEQIAELSDILRESLEEEPQG